MTWTPPTRGWIWVTREWREGNFEWAEFTDGTFRAVKRCPAKFAYPTKEKTMYWVQKTIREARRDLEWCRANVPHVWRDPTVEETHPKLWA